jgi:hypothetical protein
MWRTDVIIDLNWLILRKGELGDRILEIDLPDHENANEFSNRIILYGDSFSVRHIRFLHYLTDHKSVDDWCGSNLMYWLDLIGAATLITGQTRVRPMPIEQGSTAFMSVVGEGDDNDKFDFEIILNYKQKELDLTAIKLILGQFGIKNIKYLEYLHKALDIETPIDYQWLNCYRFLEWHFTKGKSALVKQKEWLEFVDLFGTDLRNHCKPRQKNIGLIEEVRAIAAHAIEHPYAYKDKDNGLGIVQLTLPIMKRLVIKALEFVLEGRIKFEI